MEEKKEKKKLNKKPLLICLALSLVFAIIGIVDINVNASESVVNGPLIEEQYLNVDYCLVEYDQDTEWTTYGTWNFGVPEYRVAFFYGECNSGFITSEDSDVIGKGYTLYVNDSDCPGTYYWKATLKKTTYDSDGDEYSSSTDDTSGQYCYTDDYQQGSQWCESGFWHQGLFFEEVNIDTNVPVFKDFVAMQNYLSTGTYNKDDVVINIDYDTLPIDDDMLIPKNVKYNCIVNEHTSSPEEYIYDIYDVVSWDNTSEKYRIQIDSVPVVQYHKGSIKITSDIVNLGKKTTLIKEFLGEWKNEKIFDVVGNTFEKYQNGNNSDMCDEIAFNFKNECDDKYSYNRFTESSILLFGYRVRYIDIENQKASAWVYLMPMEKEWNYKAYVMYSNGSTSNEENANGLVNEYTNMEDISDGVNDIVTENIYKDKYDVVNGDVDTQEAANWLYSVVNFVKGTPQVVGSVLGFLPQPILYGMYVTIFLGVIASGIAIVKALI